MKVNIPAERRAKPARRSSRFLCPRPPLRGSTKKMSLPENPKDQTPKNQNPLRDDLLRGFWVSADFFGASPVASALDLRTGRDPDADPRHSNMAFFSLPSKQELSTLHKIGTFYFALTLS